MNEQLIETVLIDPNPYQPRHAEDQQAVIELSQDILHHATKDFDGLMQSPTVRPISGGRYQLAFGHTRKAAFEHLEEIGKERYRKIRVNVRELTDVQMFELGVAENIKRHDLNPIEQATAMRRYMDEFGKTSKEAGEFFNCSEENVRAKVRLLNLAPIAQEKLRAGEINENTSRSLLIAQKIGGVEVVEDALGNLNNDFYDTPDDAIESAIRESPNTQEMSYRCDWRDEKKFPVKYLAPLSHNALAKLLDVQNGDKARKQLLENVENHLANGVEIQDHQFPAFLPGQLEKVRVLTNPPACTSCPFHAVFDRTHYCGLKTCYERKGLAWAQSKAMKAVKDTGIQLYVNQATDGDAVELSFWEYAHKKIFDSRTPDLRLKVKSGQFYGRNFDGLPENVQLVVVGKTAEKLLAKREKALEKGQGETVDRDLQFKIRDLREQHMRRYVYEVVTPAFVPLFSSFNNAPLVLYVYDQVMYESADFPNGVAGREDQIKRARNSKKKAEALNLVHRLIAYEVLDRALGWEYDQYNNAKSPLIECAKRAQKRAAEWGLKLPKDWMSKAEGYQTELETAVKELIQKGTVKK